MVIIPEQVKVIAHYLRTLRKPRFFKLGKREIYNPVGLWWFYTTMINKYLSAEYKENGNWATSDKGVFKAAIKHRNQRFIVRCDIKSFFDSVRFRHVQQFFRPEDHEYIKLCFINDALPQGFCTSPILSDIALRTFDIAMIKYCEENNLIYTRFCDDIYFSGKIGAWKGIKFVGEQLAKLGFKLSQDKINVMPVNTLHMVLGINVDHKKGWSPEQRRFLFNNYRRQNTQTKYLLGKGKQWTKRVSAVQ